MAILAVSILLVLTIVDAKNTLIDLYPGYGWDHLRFLDMLPIYSVQNSNASDIMQQCIAHIPIRKSELEVNSEIVDVYNSTTTSYERGYIAGGGGSYYGFGVSGSYSDQYQQVKHQQGRENTVTIRNEIRYISADVLLRRSCPLDSQFKSDIIKIADYFKTEQQFMATYESQMFVLRYGTHYTNRFRIGGHIVEENFMKTTELYQNETTKKSRQASARASFLGKLKVSASYGTQTSETTTDIDKYEEQVIYRRITSDGGHPFLIGNSLEEWQLTIEDNPIILQRTIENITMAIDPKQIHEIEEYYIYKAIEEINKAILTYIKMNLIHGCMERTSSSFNWIANINDGSCGGGASDIKFGGFLRTCAIEWTPGESPSPATYLCDSFELSNFHTNIQQCPLGFTQNLLHTSNRTQRVERVHSYKCGFLNTKTCRRTIWVGTGIITAKLYSCTKNGTELTEYTFGGSYTSNRINLITNSRSCPTDYRPVRIVNDIDVCFTQRIFSSYNLPKFAGMFSCQTESPTTGNDICPAGFSAYVIGIIENDCILHVCLKLPTQDLRSLPSISLPPYFNIIDQLNISLPSIMDADVTNESNNCRLRTSCLVCSFILLFCYMIFTFH